MFNRALVFSLLFVSAVLAASPGDWAGAKIEVNPNSDDRRDRWPVTRAEGTFVVPKEIRGDVGSSFFIGVGLDCMTCQTASVMVGIYVSKTRGNSVHIRAACQFWPVLGGWAPEWFIVSPRDKLNIIVSTTSDTEGGFRIENETTRKDWFGSFGDPNYPFCLQNAYWVVGVAAGSPLADFGQVIFRNIIAYRQNRRLRANSPIIINIKQNNQVMTKVDILETNIVDVTVKFQPEGSSGLSTTNN